MASQKRQHVNTWNEKGIWYKESTTDIMLYALSSNPSRSESGQSIGQGEWKNRPHSSSSPANSSVNRKSDLSWKKTKPLKWIAKQSFYVSEPDFLFIYFLNNLHTPCAAPTQDPEIKSPMLKPARHPRLFNVWKWDHLVTQEWQKLSGDLRYLGPVKRDDRACLNEMLGEESTLSPVYNSFTESSQLHTHLSYNWVSFWNFILTHWSVSLFTRASFND